MVHPSTENYCCAFWFICQFFLKFFFSDNFDESFLRISCEELRIILHGFDLFIFCFIDNDVGLKMLGNSDSNFLFSDRVKCDINPCVFVDFQEVCDVIYDHFKGLFLSWKLKLLFEEGIIKIENVYVPRTFLESAIKELWRVKLCVFLEYGLREANIPRIENCSHVALNQDHCRA